MAVLNQILVFDDLASGLRPRWATSSEATIKDLDLLIADALTTVR